jgi:uncharacterized SAM-binding protein YcdF (DUF218 family)
LSSSQEINQPDDLKIEVRGWGLITRRARWSLSGRGWLAFLGIMSSGAVLVFLNLYSFLAPRERLETQILVVEGWVHPYAIRAAVEEFRAGHYERVFVTGGPVTGTGPYTSPFMTSAHVGAEQLYEAGLSREVVEMVPSSETRRDRTFGAAVALRDLMVVHGMTVKKFNIVTESVHARRTRLMFQKAFGKTVKVGIIAVANPDYESKDWWRCSEGVRDVSSEAMAYMYARLVFCTFN